jgi:chloramphenicol 3-O phosphotransferase
MKLKITALLGILFLTFACQTMEQNHIENKPFIIFLNGTSSSGKTSISRALQKLSQDPLIYTGIDSFFLEMLPPQFMIHGARAHDGLLFETTKDPEQPIKLHIGEYGKRLFKAMPLCIKALTDTGNKIIVDEVLFENNRLTDYREVLKDHIVYFIGIKAPVEVIEKREHERNDRVIGLSRSLIELVHSHGKKYDLEIDTSKMTPQEAAQTILEYIANNPNPSAFNQI